MIKMSSLKQNAYIFIPGKNWKLSLAELASFFEARKCKFKILYLSKSFLVVDCEKTLSPKFVDDLGGIIKIGKVITFIPLEIIEDAFLRRKKQAQAEIKANISANCVIDDIFKMLQKKCVFGVSVYFEDPRFFRLSREMQRFVGSHFKEELESRSIRAKFMGFPRNRELPQLTHVEVLKKGLIEKSAEILLCIGKGKAFVSNTIAVHNPFEFQKRDISRPVQRKIFSMPPRLAKIMVNLSACIPGKVLLDPFCGVGTILQEALLMRAQVIGMDINPWCVKASRANLDWLRKEYSLKNAKCKVLQGDVRSLIGYVDEETVDCIVTEPDLGPALRHFPTEFYARRIVEKLKPLFNDFLEESHKALKNGGKLVFVIPHIKTRSRVFVSMGLEEKTTALGFKLCYPFEREIFAEDGLLVEDLLGTSSFVDMGERHKIGREIHVFRK
uniref:Methyltransferase domain-containing protein n=1 Tax=candidate division WWE3 bacterium TaxID=2053526 RepID=A0A7C4XNV5_UNCKA